ncbi:hypothetical protein ACIBG8_03645 [Nonomuraea sp. NPDC050556]|uniref:hypothetical protein n=1 Tax=Nonomuraea sp. NPDC050556 TaxID=3364369 RepID=UPI0037944A4D
MHPNPPQPMFPQYGQPPRQKPRANTAAAVVAGVLALFTAAMLVWFALNDAIVAGGQTGMWSRMVVLNVLGGVIGAASLLVPAGFTVARKIPGAWTLCALCTFYVVASLVVSPLLFGTPFSAQLTFLFGFHKTNGVIIGLAVIFAILTAITAAIAASVKSFR